MALGELLGGQGGSEIVVVGLDEDEDLLAEVVAELVVGGPAARFVDQGGGALAAVGSYQAADVAAAIEWGDADFLVRAAETETGRMSHPTLDHYLPLLYPAGAADERDAASFPVVGFDLNSLSMRALMCA